MPRTRKKGEPKTRYNVKDPQKVFVFNLNNPKKNYWFYASDSNEKKLTAERNSARQLLQKNRFGGFNKDGTQISCFAKDWIEAKKIKEFLVLAKMIMESGGKLKLEKIYEFMNKVQ